MRIVFAALLVLLVAGRSPTTQPAARSAFAILHVNVIPMAGTSPVLADHSVLVRNGQVDGVIPSDSAPVPPAMTQIDGRGKFLIPGLADMHVHLEYFDNPDILGLFIANGVTTIRNMDGRPYILEWKRRIAAGALSGPRILTAGPLLDGNPPVRPDNTVVTTAAEARNAVEAQVREGYDLVKVYSALSGDAYNAIVATARAHRVPVTGHIPRGVGVQQAIAAQRSIEHLTDFGSEIQSGTAPGWSRRYLAMPIDAAKVAGLANQLAKAGTWVVPTLVQPVREVQRDEEVTRALASQELRLIPADGRQLWERQVRGAAARMDEEDWKLIAAGRMHRSTIVKAFHAAGVRLLAGTDTPNPFVVPGFSIHDELSLLVESGLTPAAALASATREAGIYLEANIGTIQKGVAADLVLLDGNPLENIANTRRIAGLTVNGRWMDAEDRAALLRKLRAP